MEQNTERQSDAIQIPASEAVLGRNYLWDARLKGRYELHMDGSFGKTFCSVLSWKRSVMIEPGKEMSFWPEFHKDAEVELRFCLHLQRDDASEDEDTELLEADNLTESVVIPACAWRRRLGITLQLRGVGRIVLGSIHLREKIPKGAAFMAGSLRRVDENREELFTYFNPMDRKAPLTVYFSGRRPQEGFDGVDLMWEKRMPFLLIADPRCGGSCGYLGSEQYEDAVELRIRGAMEQLDLASEDVIMIGSSMGAAGALYHGSRIHPGAMVLGRPVINLGTMAQRERIRRPGGFPASLDILRKLTGDVDDASAERLNRRMWSRLDGGSFARSEMAIGYMEEDDYDPEGYLQLLHHLRGQQCRIYGKGFPGRHNDNQEQVKDWLRLQYDRILKERYGR